jgi:hypothetical protein
MTKKDIDSADSSRETDHQRTEAIEKILVAQRLLREAILILCRSSHSNDSPNSGDAAPSARKGLASCRD